MSHVLQCVWPIEDETFTRNELIDEATEQLGRLADQAHAIITGPPLWYITDADTTPGWHAYAPGSVLVAVMPAESYGPVRLDGRRRRIEVDPAAVERIVAGNPPALIREVDRKAAVIAMTGGGRDTREIAAQLGLKPKTVAQIRTRHNRARRAGTAA